MTMEVYGQSPRSKKGVLFINSVWRWHPLARICHLVAPEIAATCTEWLAMRVQALTINQPSRWVANSRIV